MKLFSILKIEYCFIVAYHNKVNYNSNRNHAKKSYLRIGIYMFAMHFILII